MFIVPMSVNDDVYEKFTHQLHCSDVGKQSLCWSLYNRKTNKQLENILNFITEPYNMHHSLIFGSKNKDEPFNLFTNLIAVHSWFILDVWYSSRGQPSYASTRYVCIHFHFHIWTGGLHDYITVEIC